MTLNYSTLKTASTQVLEFTKEYVEDKNIDLRTSIAEDLSLWELDGYVFLDNFQKRFGLTLPEEAYDYVCPSELKFGPFKKFFYIILFLVTLPIILLVYPFLFNNRKEKLKKKIRRNRKRLTLGDLAATLATGQFVKRESIKIEFEK